VELKSRVGSLQQVFDNSEAVQKEFVRVSQSLQVQLERIREADTQVRWQHEEDVEECHGCRSGFSFTRSKVCTLLLQVNCRLKHTLNKLIMLQKLNLCQLNINTEHFCYRNWEIL
jgi:hypothetical protein